MKRIKQTLFALALGTFPAILLVAPPAAQARPEYVTPFILRYPDASRLTSCGTCHMDFFGENDRNAYGDAFEAAGGASNQAAALAAIEPLDSDGDGTSNLAEINTDTGFLPGFNCVTYSSAINAPPDVANYVDPGNVGCGSVTSTTVSGGTTTTTTLPPGLCGPTPLPTCQSASKVSFQVKDKAGESKDQVKWAWKKGPAFTADDVGDPTATAAHALCVYDRISGTPELTMSMLISPNGSWKRKGSKGWLYKDTPGTFAGIQKLQLKAGAAGKTKVQVKARGANIPMPLHHSIDLMFAKDPTLTVQLINSTGTCWTSEFSNAQKNTPALFKAK